MKVIFLWFALGVISSIIASNKGRSGCGWFLVGIILGPIGIILALSIKKQRDQKF